MVIQDKRKKAVELYYNLKVGDQFEWEGWIYVKTTKDAAFCLSANEIKPYIPAGAEVTRVSVTIVVEDYK